MLRPLGTALATDADEKRVPYVADWTRMKVMVAARHKATYETWPRSMCSNMAPCQTARHCNASSESRQCRFADGAGAGQKSMDGPV